MSRQHATERSGATNAIRIGYARISTRAQDDAAQLELLGGADCREIVEETISTRRAERPKLTTALDGMKPGDTLVITKPDRLARSVKELLVFLEDQLAPRGINLHILTGICAGTHKPNGQTMSDKMLFMVAAMAAEMKRDLIQERTLDGLAAARAQGRTGGRPVMVTEDVLAAARARRERGQSVTRIARELGVGRSTLYRALEDDDPPGAAAGTTTAAAVDQDHDDQPAAPAATTTRSPSSPPEPAESTRPWTADADPARRPHWYTDAELDAVQVIKSDIIDDVPVYWVVIAGELLGTVTRRLGGRGWHAHHRNRTLAAHTGPGKHPATRDAAVLDLVADVHRIWQYHHARARSTRRNPS
ncbi:recombinase family protein [Nonomuraea sp. NPDC050643]|uniref:recombinase family protein n=1 Tax=Nonomuraea sp. NPDC050643 TaxID=3155660 RepID=UPI0033FCA0F0